jgi:hypothetical protein
VGLSILSEFLIRIGSLFVEESALFFMNEGESVGTAEIL